MNSSRSDTPLRDPQAEEQQAGGGDNPVMPPVVPAVNIGPCSTTVEVAAVVPMVNVTVCGPELVIVALDGIEHVGRSEPDPPATVQVSATCPRKPLAGVTVMVLFPGLRG